jgi:hypothetical protein
VRKRPFLLESWSPYTSLACQNHTLLRFQMKTQKSCFLSGLRGGVDLSKCSAQAPLTRPGTVQYSLFAVDAPEKSQLVVATAALGGYLPLVRNSGNDWTTSAAPYPGDDASGGLPRLLAAMRSEAPLGLNSLRMRVPASSEAHYSMLRYDALGTGRAALVAMNLGPSSGDVKLELAGLPPQLLGAKARTPSMFSPLMSFQVMLRLPRQARDKRKETYRMFLELQGSGRAACCVRAARPHPHSEMPHRCHWRGTGTTASSDCSCRAGYHKGI